MMIFRTALLSLLLVGAAANANPPGVVPNAQMNVKQEKKDLQVRFERAAVAGVADEEKFDGLVGWTSDFPGGPLQVFIAFDASVPEDKLIPLANFQGRLRGSVQCKRVRIGNSPQFPDAKLGVLAEQCAIKSLVH